MFIWIDLCKLWRNTKYSKKIKIIDEKLISNFFFSFKDDKLIIAQTVEKFWAKPTNLSLQLRYPHQQSNSKGNLTFMDIDIFTVAENQLELDVASGGINYHFVVFNLKAKNLLKFYGTFKIYGNK